MTAKSESSQVVFLLGAGASVKAGVPDTHSFVREFLQSLDEPDTRHTIDKIINTLTEWKGGDIDIELLLETLTKLDARNEESLLRFYDSGTYTLEAYPEKGNLIKGLKDFIKKKAIVSSGERVKYLEPLLGFIEENRPLDILSVNYDTGIEQFCSVYKLMYQDGFDVHWNPQVFETPDTDIRLYKLHGSVMWYRSDRGGYLKLPVMESTGSIQLITGETAETLMLYPIQKWDYAGPLLELLLHAKEILESRSCRFLIVVGYSFRDEHVKRILWDAATKNRRLSVIIVDPSAYELYSNKLKHYDARAKTPSSLYGRVICLPYKFEEILPFLRNYYLKHLHNGLSQEDTMRQFETKGEETNWLIPLGAFESAEHTEKVEYLLGEKLALADIQGSTALSLELPVKMALNLYANRQVDLASEYMKMFQAHVKLTYFDRMHIDPIGQTRIIQIIFGYLPSNSGYGLFPADQGIQLFRDLSQYFKARIPGISGSHPQINRMHEWIKALQKYLKSFVDRPSGFSVDHYARLRKTEIPDNFKDKYDNFARMNSPETKDEIIATVRRIEFSTLRRLLGGNWKS